MNSIMKNNRRLVMTLAVMAAVSTLSGCGQVVEAGHVGLKIEKYGDSRGVQNDVLGPGRYWVGWNTDVVQFPTFTQTTKWTKTANEGKPIDESISFQVAGGITANTDLAVSYHVEQVNVPKIYQKYRQGLEEVSDNALRNMVRDEMNSAGLKYTVEELQGEGKAKLMKDVVDSVQLKAQNIGITVESISWLNDLRWPENVRNSINAKIQATQDAMRVENEVRKTKAEQEKTVVVAEAQVHVAEAEAKSIELRGRAYKDNPQVLQLELAKLQADALSNTKVQVMGTMPTLFRNIDQR